MDPDLPRSFVDFVIGVLLSRLTTDTNGTLSSAYHQVLAFETVSQLLQRLKVLVLRLRGHIQAQGLDILSKIIRRQSPQMIEVEFAEASEIIFHNFKLRRPIWGEIVGRRGHIVQSRMMLASRGFSSCPLYPHLKAMSS